MRPNRFMLALLVLLVLAAVAAVLLPGAMPMSSAPAIAASTDPVPETLPPPPPDTEPPAIHGVHDIYVGRYAAPAYRQGVTVTDNSGEAVLEVDSGGVNTNQPGAYTVTYIAWDAAGNETRATARVIVSGITEEGLAKLAGPVLDSIIQPGMTDRDKAYAIHQWIKQHVAYVGTGEKEGILEGAYNGLTLRRGDCYTFYALAKYLLHRAGIDSVIDMEREPGYKETHYWLLLNLGEGWYHYDACRLRNKSQPHDGFMMTDSEAQNFAASDNHPEFYRYRKELLPEGVEIVP